MMPVRAPKNVEVLRQQLSRWDSKFHPRRQGQPSVSSELEALRQQVNQLQEQVNYFLLVWARLDMRSFSGLRILGILLYIVSSPFRWAGRLLALIRSPRSYWAGFYWLCFTWILAKNGGLEEVLHFLRHPRRLFATIGRFQP